MILYLLIHSSSHSKLTLSIFTLRPFSPNSLCADTDFLCVQQILYENFVLFFGNFLQIYLQTSPTILSDKMHYKSEKIAPKHFPKRVKETKKMRKNKYSSGRKVDGLGSHPLCSSIEIFSLSDINCYKRRSKTIFAYEIDRMKNEKNGQAIKHFSYEMQIASWMWTFFFP